VLQAFPRGGWQKGGWCPHPRTHPQVRGLGNPRMGICSTSDIHCCVYDLALDRVRFRRCRPQFGGFSLSSTRWPENPELRKCTQYNFAAAPRIAATKASIHRHRLACQMDDTNRATQTIHRKIHSSTPPIVQSFAPPA
jgi:hypothetical protein